MSTMFTSTLQCLKMTKKSLVKCGFLIGFKHCAYYHVPHESILVEQKTFFGSTPKIESGNTLEEEFFLIKPAAGGTTGFCGLVLLLFLSNFREQSHEFLQSAIDLRAAPRVMRDIWTFPTKGVRVFE